MPPYGRSQPVRIQLLPTLEQARILRKALSDFLSSTDPMVDEVADAGFALMAEISNKIYQESKHI